VVSRTSLAVVVLISVLGPSAALAQSEFVIHKEGTKLYHRPSCPIVLDLRGVLAMTRAQAEARGYKAHPDCDPNNPNAPAPKGPPPPPATVYLDGSKYYHRKTCSTLRDPQAAKAAALESAGKNHWPCPTCRPPVRKRSTENAIPGTKRGR
jgi:hypothetical protein